MVDGADDTGLTALRRHVSDQPGDIPARIRLAGQLPRGEALELLQQGVWFAAADPVRLQALGQAFEAIGAVADAVEMLEQAMRSAPDDGQPVAALAGLWARLGESGKARLMASRAASMGFDAGLAPHEDGPTPLMVRAMFDQYAARFEAHLSDTLRYHAPEQLGALISCHVSSELERALDIGCGTGLMAQYLRPFATHLTGIDLSPAMLAEAAQKHRYDDLVEAEAVGYLLSCAPAPLIVAADVLVYMGELAPLFLALKRALTPGGMFFATLETHEGEGIVLTQGRRYAHSHIYIEYTAQAAGLALAAYHPIVVRHDAGQPLPGALFALTQQAGALHEAKGSEAQPEIKGGSR